MASSSNTNALKRAKTESERANEGFEQIVAKHIGSAISVGRTLEEVFEHLYVEFAELIATGLKSKEDIQTICTQVLDRFTESVRYCPYKTGLRLRDLNAEVFEDNDSTG